MSRELGAIANTLNLPEIYPFFAIEMMFDTEEITYNGQTIQSEPLYLWTGLGDLVVDGKTYIGSGAMLHISEVTETSDIRAAGASVTLTGLSSDILALALSQPYQGRICSIKFGILNANKEILLKEDAFNILLETGASIDVSVGDPNALITLFVGYMDQMMIEESAETCTIQMNIESKLIDLSRPRIFRYTSENQKALYPNDLAFDFIPDLQDAPLVWGRETAEKQRAKKILSEIKIFNGSFGGIVK